MAYFLLYRILYNKKFTYLFYNLFFARPRMADPLSFFLRALFTYNVPRVCEVPEGIWAKVR